MSNIKMLIQGHNKKTLNNIAKTENTNTEESLYNCRNKNLCPLKKPRLPQKKRSMWEPRGDLLKQGGMATLAI